MACNTTNASLCTANETCLWADACYPAEFNCALVDVDLCASTPNCAWANGCREAAHDCGRYDRAGLCALHGCDWTDTVCIPGKTAEQGGAELLWTWYAMFALLIVLVLRNARRRIWAEPTTQSTFEERQFLL